MYNKQKLTEYYETYFNIHDFYNPKGKLDHVGFHPKEEYFNNSTYENRLRFFLENDIQKLTGMTFLQYLDLPTSEISQINKVVNQFNLRKVKASETAIRKEENERKKEEELRRREDKRLTR